MKTVSYIQLQEKYGGKFVAKANGNVVVFGATYKSLIDKLTKKHLRRENLTFAFIHPKGVICEYRISFK